MQEPSKVKREDFKSTDECSIISPLWYFFTGYQLGFAGCCCDHDYAYYKGGDLSLRKEADKKLAECIIQKGYRNWIAKVVYIGVRLGGVHWLPTSYRWGFGYKYPKYKS